MPTPTKQHIKDSQAALTLIKTGACCTIQDSGRRGLQELGISHGGAADLPAFFWANRLIGNSPNDACLEILFGGFKAVFSQNTCIAITGAHTDVFINNTLAARWSILQIRTGDTLEIKTPRAGLINYVSIAGGFQCQPILGSRSTIIRDGIGPNNGLALQNNQDVYYLQLEQVQLKQLLIEESQLSQSQFKKNRLTQRDPTSIPRKFIPSYTEELCLGLIPSQQNNNFDHNAKAVFFDSVFEISPQSNRMGYQLKGASIKTGTVNLLSEGIAQGAVQIPPDGQPIILLSDHQSLGGYPKIGNISRLDCFRLSQRRAGEKVRFRPTTLIAAQEKLAKLYRFFNFQL
ncbi:MAG: biotin-dependent carboxylase-like uncharacterized protein [Flavobacteriales bacterium]|jgi:biotin-dependent carboxylase-like uncharacterized protein